jgi:hypothetical protein
MGVEARPKPGVESLVNVRLYFTEEVLVDGGGVCIVGADAGLVVVELAWIIAVEFVEKLDDVGVAVGACEGIACAVEAED